MKLKNTSIEEMPREKLISLGPNNLTNSELLAIILCTGSKTENVLSLSNSLFDQYNLKSLSKLKISELKRQFGIGNAKSCQIIACFELGRRLSAFHEDKKPQINTAKDVADIFIPQMKILDKEHFKGIYLDSRKRIIKQETIFIGSLNESLVHPRDIFKIALEENAAAVILLHNHPSEDSSPTKSDIKSTQEIILAGKIMGIPVLDHIIIGGNNFTSFKEQGLI